MKVGFTIIGGECVKKTYIIHRRNINYTQQNNSEGSRVSSAHPGSRAWSKNKNVSTSFSIYCVLRLKACYNGRRESWCWQHVWFISLIAPIWVLYLSCLMYTYPSGIPPNHAPGSSLCLSCVLALPLLTSHVLVFLPLCSFFFIQTVAYTIYITFCTLSFFT